MKYYKLTDKKTKSSFTLSINEFHELNAKTIKEKGSFAFSNKYDFEIINPHSKENILTGVFLVGVFGVAYILIHLLYNAINLI